MHKALSSPIDRALVKDIHSASRVLELPYRLEVERVCSYGVQMVTLAEVGFVTGFSDEGRENLKEMLSALLSFKASQDAKEDTRAAWARFDALGHPNQA